MFDGAVLAGGVHRLENQQDAPTVLGVEAFLKFGQQAGAFAQSLHRHRFVIPLQVQGVVGIDAGQAKALAIFHLIGLGEFVALAQQLVAIHGIDHGLERSARTQWGTGPLRPAEEGKQPIFALH